MRVASIGSMRPSINMLGPGLLLKPISVAMGKPKASPLSQPTHLRKHYPPSTCLGWASSQAQYPSRWANPRLHLLHSLPLHLGIILRGSFHHRRHDGERSSGGNPTTSRRCCRHGGWCKCPYGRSRWWWRWALGGVVDSGDGIGEDACVVGLKAGVALGGVTGEAVSGEEDGDSDGD